MYIKKMTRGRFVCHTEPLYDKRNVPLSSFLRLNRFFAYRPNQSILFNLACHHSLALKA